MGSGEHEFDVFLSFKGSDTRRSFTDHLYAALKRAGIKAFRDEDELERGENLNPQLEKAIKQSAVSIIVFSENYASSSWCLDELTAILERKRRFDHKVLTVFYNVDPAEVRHQIGSFGKGFARHKERADHHHACTDQESRIARLEKIEGWRKALREAADLSGMHLTNWYESKFIDEIVSDIQKKLQSQVWYISKHLVGINNHVKNIVSWLQDGSADSKILVIWGIGGIGKTTIAEYVYESNIHGFDGGSFLTNIGEFCKEPKGLLGFQTQLHSDLTRKKGEKIRNYREGIRKIKQASQDKKVFIVLDDVTETDQLEKLLEPLNFCLGSKVIITTRQKSLLASVDVKLYEVECLDYENSLVLFSWHAFRQERPMEDLMEQSKEIVSRCGNLPLALKVLGSCLFGADIDVWNCTLLKLKEVANPDIQKVLQVSYDSLKDDKDKKLFLRVACFFIRQQKEYMIEILGSCGLYPIVGIKNLNDRCLITIESGILNMHQLLQDMAREIARQESPNDPGKRSILCRDEDSFDVLKENTGTEAVEGLILDMQKIKKEDCNRSNSMTALRNSKKRTYEDFLGFIRRNEFLGKLLPSHVGDLKIDEFSRMPNLMLVKLNHVHLTGSCNNFPKKLRWICWQNYPLGSIPRDLPLNNLVALDMQHSSLQRVWDGCKFLGGLKYLNLSYSRALVRTPDFRGLPKLESLILKSCSSLALVCKSIALLECLVLLDLEDCTNLMNIPCLPKSLATLEMSGCTCFGESTLVFKSEKESFYSQLMKYASQTAARPVNTWASLPSSLVNLRLVGCNLSDDSFPRDFSHLSSLKNLDVSKNLISKLPECVRSLPRIDKLTVTYCPRLQSLLCVPSTLKSLIVICNESLEIVKFTSSNPGSSSSFYDNKKLGEVGERFMLALTGNVDHKVLRSLGLGSMQRDIKVMYEFGVYSTYVPGSEVPSSITFREKGSIIAVSVPSSRPVHPNNNKILGLNVSFVWSDHHHGVSWGFKVDVRNRTKDVGWVYEYQLPDDPDDGEDYVWLSMWKCGGLLEDGDRVRVCISPIEEYCHNSLRDGERCGEIEECGVRIVYEDDLMTDDNVTPGEDHCPLETTIRWSDKQLVDFSDHHAPGSTYVFTRGVYRDASSYSSFTPKSDRTNWSDKQLVES